MSRRSHCAERTVHFRNANGVDGCQRASGRHSRRLRGMRPNRSVACAQLAAMLRYLALDQLNVFARVNDCQLIVAGAARREPYQSAQQSGHFQPVHHCAKAGRLFRMSWSRIVPLDCRIGGESGRTHSGLASSARDFNGDELLFGNRFHHAGLLASEEIEVRDLVHARNRAERRA